MKFLEYIGSNPAISIFLRKIVELNFVAHKNIIEKYFHLEQGEKILDIGCGTGEFSPFFLKEYYVGIDIDDKNITYAKAHYNQEFKVADARDLPFGDNSFDKILIVGVLHHLSMEDVQKVLQEIQRILVPKGQALIIEDTLCDSPITKLMHSLDQGAHIRSKEAWQEILTGNFIAKTSFTFKSGICFYSAFILENIYESF